MTPCGACGADTVLRHRRRDGHAFFGCSRFPACSWAQDAPERLNREAPTAPEPLGVRDAFLISTAVYLGLRALEHVAEWVLS